MSLENDNNSLDHNKKVVSQFIELTWNQGRFNLARSLICRDFSYCFNAMNTALNFDMTSEVMKNVRASMDDFEVMIEDIIAEGNKVVTQSSFCGTLVKPMFGFQPSEHVVTFGTVSFWEIRKGLIQQSTTMLDMAELMRQMKRTDYDIGLDQVAGG